MGVARVRISPQLLGCHCSVWPGLPSCVTVNRAEIGEHGEIVLVVSGDAIPDGEHEAEILVRTLLPSVVATEPGDSSERHIQIGGRVVLAHLRLLDGRFIGWCCRSHVRDIGG